MILGIDLGTSNSMAAIYKDGQTILIESSTGGYSIPSVVSMDDDGAVFAGTVAKERKLMHLGATIDMFKRSMGTTKCFKLGDKELKAEELSAIVLSAIKADAEHFIGEPVSEAVISVPAFFTNPQRQAAIRAAKLAGLQVKRIINEPTAAALAYGMQNNESADKEQRAIIVLDLGGGTFDISVMEINDKVMEVVAVCGDNKLGGSDFTSRIIELFMQKNNITQTLSAEEEAVLWSKAELAKQRLSDHGYIELECSIGDRLYSMKLSEAEYEEACFDLLERIRKLTLRAVKESQYEAEEIEEIVMVGGGTRLELVHKMIEAMAGRKLGYKVSPDEAVAAGAAIQGALLEHDEGLKELVMTDVCPYYIMTEKLVKNGLDYRVDKEIFIKKNTVIPTKMKMVTNIKPSTVVSPIIQSTDIYGSDAITIGSLKYNVPEPVIKDLVDYADTACNNMDGYCPVHISVSYDYNGLVEYEAYIPENDMTYKAAFSTYENISDGQDEMKPEAFKLKDRENDMNELLIARAENVYAELGNKERRYLSDVITEFEAAINTGKITRIRKAKEQLTQLLYRYDKDMSVF